MLPFRFDAKLMHWLARAAGVRPTAMDRPRDARPARRRVTPASDESLLMHGGERHAVAARGPRASAWASPMPAGPVFTLQPGGPADALQQAIDALSPGDTLVLAAGTYPGGIVIRHKHGITIRGEQAVICNSSGDGLFVQRSSAITLIGLRVVGCARDGIVLTGSRGLTLSRCEAMRNGGGGLVASDVEDLAIVDCEASHNMVGAGIDISQPAGELRLEGNRLIENGASGIRVSAVQAGGVMPVRLRIGDNQLQRNGNGREPAIRLAGVREGQITRNLITDHAAGGVWLGDDGAGPESGCRDNLIAQNTIVMSAGAGAGVGRAVDVAAGSTGNRVIDNLTAPEPM